jgi:hypothetical protein
LVAKPASIRPGQATVLVWEAQNADGVRIEPEIGNVPATGSRKVAPLASVTYVATATGPGGSTSESIEVNVISEPAPPTISVVGRPAMIKSGETTQLEWRAQNAHAVQIQPGIGNVPVSGRLEVSPRTSLSYVVTATGPGGTASDRVSIVVASGDVKIKKLECKSRNWQPAICAIRTAVPQNARIIGVIFEQEDSKSRCIEGKTYHIDLERESVWVDQGCDADFRVFYRIAP